MSTEDTIQEFAPTLRTSSQSEAFRIALQMLGDLTGFGIDYFDFDESPWVRAHGNRGLLRQLGTHEEHPQARERSAEPRFRYCKGGHVRVARVR